MRAVRTAACERVSITPAASVAESHARTAARAKALPVMILGPRRIGVRGQPRVRAVISRGGGGINRPARAVASLGGGPRRAAATGHEHAAQREDRDEQDEGERKEQAEDGGGADAGKRRNERHDRPP